MDSNHATAAARPAGRTPKRLFTVASANETLVFVRKVVQDIVRTYGELMALRSERDDLAGIRSAPERIEELDAQIEGAVTELSRLQEELADVGCELKDWKCGLIDFPAMHAGRRVWLCWRLGESAVTHWHELEAGFAARQPIGPDFGHPAQNVASG